MKSIAIKGSKRESVGKKATKALRNADMVPCVIYGGDEPISFSAHELAFKNLVYTPNAHTVVIELGDTKINAILQDIQFHPVTDRIIHMDFYQIFDDKEVSVEIPVRTVGTSRGVRSGGVLRIVTRKLRIKALPANLPDVIEVDISEMRIGNKIYVTAVESDVYKVMHTENTVICQVRSSRTAIAEIEEEEAEEAAAEEAAEAAEAEEEATDATAEA